MQDTITNSLTEFRDKFDASTDPALWEKLVEEEAAEVMDAVANLLKEFADLTYVAEGFRQVAGDTKLSEKVSNDMIKAATYMGIIDLVDFEEVFKRVHESNMSKLGEDGKPIRRSDGKITKGPNYKPPVLTDLL